MKKSVFVITIFFLLFASCGTSKELNSANMKNQSLDSTVKVLNGLVADQKAKLADDNNKIAQLKMENQKYGQEAQDCRAAKAAIAQKVENLNKALAEHGTSMKEIRRKAAEALNKFEDAGVDVTYKNGLVYISMQDKLLFPSGSTKINDQGRQALSVVADVLNDYKGVTAIVVGNTDSIQIRKSYKDNWSLSTERANTIVRVLRDNYSINPARLTAAGKSKYDPVASNATAEGRAKNRRTDIILNPDLSRLWELIDKE
jgi:chemotaxis protein MotB